MQETLVRFLGQEDLLEKGKAIHSSILAWRIPGTVQGVAKSQCTTEQLSLLLHADVLTFCCSFQESTSRASLVPLVLSAT